MSAGGDLIESEHEATLALWLLGLKTTPRPARVWYHGPNAREAGDSAPELFRGDGGPFHGDHDTLSSSADGAVAAALAASRWPSA